MMTMEPIDDLPAWVCECDRPDRLDSPEWHHWDYDCAMWAEIGDGLRFVTREERRGE